MNEFFQLWVEIDQGEGKEPAWEMRGFFRSDMLADQKGGELRRQEGLRVLDYAIIKCLGWW